MWEEDWSPYTNHTECKLRPRNGESCFVTASLELFIGINNKQVSYFVTNTGFSHYRYREKFLSKLKNKKSTSKQVSIIQKDIWCWNALYLLYLHEKQDRKRLYALHHLISLSYSHWFFVSLFIQNNSTNNSFFLGQQLTELTSIIKGDGLKGRWSPFSQRLIFFKAKHRHKQEAIYHLKGSTWKSQPKTGHSQYWPASFKS